MQGEKRKASRCTGVNFRAPRWSKAEEELLRKSYPTEGSALADRLPGRSRSAVIQRAKKLGIWFDGDFKKVRASVQAVNMWSAEEDDVIRCCYPTEGRKVSNRLPKRTPDACYMRAQKLGVRVNIVQKRPKAACLHQAG